MNSLNELLKNNKRINYIYDEYLKETIRERTFKVIVSRNFRRYDFDNAVDLNVVAFGNILKCSKHCIYFPVIVKMHIDNFMSEEKYRFCVNHKVQLYSYYVLKYSFRNNKLMFCFDRKYSNLQGIKAHKIMDHTTPYRHSRNFSLYHSARYVLLFGSKTKTSIIKKMYRDAFKKCEEELSVC